MIRTPLFSARPAPRTLNEQNNLTRSMTSPLACRTASPVRRLAALAMVLGTLLTGTMAHAERADRDKPINIEADNMTYDDLKQVNVFIGHVVLTKGTILIKADRAVVTQDPQGYQYAVATMDSGNLAYFRQKRDGLDEYIEGNADKLEYDGKRDFTTLTGRAIVRRLQGLSKVIDTVTGNVITYDGQKDFYTASSDSGSTTGGGRVRAMLAPATNNGASPPGAASAPSGSTSGGATPATGAASSTSTTNKTPGTDKN